MVAESTKKALSYGLTYSEIKF